jgi:hypothetical protein
MLALDTVPRSCAPVPFGLMIRRVAALFSLPSPARARDPRSSSRFCAGRAPGHSAARARRGQDMQISISHGSP